MHMIPNLVCFAVIMFAKCTSSFTHIRHGYMIDTQVNIPLP